MLCAADGTTTLCRRAVNGRSSRQVSLETGVDIESHCAASEKSILSVAVARVCVQRGRSQQCS
jgi:hypothetical protein